MATLHAGAGSRKSGHEGKDFWAWSVSARVYTRTYLRIAHQLDEDVFAYLGDRLQGAVVADCGCGPGVVTQKLVQRGARKVVAIDFNTAMLRQVADRMEQSTARDRVVLVHRSCEGDALTRAREEHLEGRGYDVILFKRSLYMPRPRARALLAEAAKLLAPGGHLVVVHPERRLLRHAFEPPFLLARHTIYHLVNRWVSRIAEWLGGEEYTLYTSEELLSLLAEVAIDCDVVVIPSRQRAFNLVAIRRRTAEAQRRGRKHSEEADAPAIYDGPRYPEHGYAAAAHLKR